MAFELLITNASGDQVIEFKKTLYVKESGLTKDYDTIYTEARTDGTAKGVSYSFPHVRNIIGYSPLMGRILGLVTQVASQSGTCYEIGSGHGLYMPTMNMEPSDTVFYQVSDTGLLTHTEHLLDFPDGPVGGFCSANTEGDAHIPYKIVSTDLPGFTPDPGFHVLVNDDAGVLVFDSRYPLFSVFQTEIVAQSVVADIMDNNTTHDITLTKSAPDCYIACPFLITFSSWSGGGLRFLRIKQINDTTLRLSRVTVNASTSGTPRQFAQDLLIFIGR
jgi:hypothetical protein